MNAQRKFPYLRRRAQATALAALTAVTAACASTISTQQEVAMGDDYARQINQQIPLIRDASLNQYLDGLGSAIARVADQRGIRYHFYIVNSDGVNAMAVPGGHIYVTRGLIERTDNLTEAAGVLAHEIAHVTERHSIEQMGRAQQANLGLAVLYGVILGRPPSTVERVGVQVGGAAVFANYSRDAEREADQQAVPFLIRAGIHPEGLITMFEKLLEERQRNPSAVEQWFASHPTTRERIDNVRAHIASIPASQLQGLTRNTTSYREFQARLRGQPAPPR